MEVARTGDEQVLRLYGELDLVRAEDLEAALVDLAAPEVPDSPDDECTGTRPYQRRVVVDLSQLEFIDSTGLSALLVARHRIALLGSSLEIRGAAGAARRVFEAAGLEDVLDD